MNFELIAKSDCIVGILFESIQYFRFGEFRLFLLREARWEVSISAYFSSNLLNFSQKIYQEIEYLFVNFSKT